MRGEHDDVLGRTSSLPQSRSTTARPPLAWSSVWSSSTSRPSGPSASGSTSPSYFFITSRWIAWVLRQLTVRSNGRNSSGTSSSAS